MITDHFSVKEFSCEDGSVYPCKWIDERLYPLCLDLEKIRAKAGRPIVITSGYRTKKYNDLVGGAKESQHLIGKAVDIRMIKEVDLGKIITDLIACGEICDGGVGFYKDHIHYDHGASRRWGVKTT